uniref:RNase H type-1 domain-containing protein n=1 Tax=Nicotiana tabacum TaxID=4097 RepID=A0A1S4C4C0_TOBAC|nr:PREDICTED: uncharacterized protein LOC107815006 [Nicotiana tabacum]
MAWFKEGDRNTKFFHAQVNGRRKRLQLKRIQNNMGNWIDEEDQIPEEVVNFFKDQFCEIEVPTEFCIIDHVPWLIDEEQNAKLISMPTREEIKHVVLGLNGESAGGPDSFIGAFYHSCWDIIGEDIFRMVTAFFYGGQLPKCVTHTNLVLLPKKKEIVSFSDMRRISLSNFANKIFSRVIHNRLVELLPNLISEEQAGFVKGRSIIKNVLLTQEIITDIRLSARAGPNVVIKLDMMKAYDTLSWLFLTKMLRKLGFCQRFIGLIYDIVGNNWYYVLLNGLPHGFFKSSRGLVMEVLCAYEVASGQKVNKGKSIVYMHHSTNLEVVRKVERITGIMSSIGGNSRHWSSWNTLCMPCEEGGIGFRSLHDVTKALFCKLWWNFRTKPSLWSLFMSQKYCKKLIAIIVPWRKGSHVWRKMLECRDIIEHQNKWHPKMGSSLFWFDNWTGLGALYFFVPSEFGIDESIHNVYDVLEDGDWNINRLMEILPEEYALRIVEKIIPPVLEDVIDVPYWMLEARGHFSVKSAWEYIRRRDEPRVAYKMIWVKGLPFKIAFFMWKVWKAKLPLDDYLRRLGYIMPSKCWCCAQPKEESLVHMFFTSIVATTVWKYFLSRGGMALSGLSMHQAITKCWTSQVIPQLKPIMQAFPSCIVWKLWKRRNSLKYGDSVSISSVIYQVSTALQCLVQTRKPGLKVPHKWHDLLSMMENYTPRLKYQKVIWEQQIEGWLKVNTDGASKGNPGRSAIGFCVRDEEGEIIYAVGREIAEGTNT